MHGSEVGRGPYTTEGPPWWVTLLFVLRSGEPEARSATLGAWVGIGVV